MVLCSNAAKLQHMRAMNLFIWVVKHTFNFSQLLSYKATSSELRCVLWSKWGWGNVARERLHVGWRSNCPSILPLNTRTSSSWCDACRSSPQTTRRGWWNPEHRSDASSGGWRPSTSRLRQPAAEHRASLRFPSSCGEDVVHVGVVTDSTSSRLYSNKYVLSMLLCIHHSVMVWSGRDEQQHKYGPTSLNARDV